MTVDSSYVKRGHARIERVPRVHLRSCGISLLYQPSRMYVCSIMRHLHMCAVSGVAYVCVLYQPLYEASRIHVCCMRRRVYM